MLTFSEKSTAVTVISLVADSLLSLVHANSKSDGGPYAMAVERFIRQLDDTADLVAAMGILDAAREYLVDGLEDGSENAPAVALVYVLSMAMRDPEVSQYWAHADTDRKS